MAKREVCPMCKGCGHVIVLNWPEHCPKCKRTGFVKTEPKKPATGVPEAPAPHPKLLAEAVQFLTELTEKDGGLPPIQQTATVVVLRALAARGVDLPEGTKHG